MTEDVQFSGKLAERFEFERVLGKGRMSTVVKTIEKGSRRIEERDQSQQRLQGLAQRLLELATQLEDLVRSFDIDDRDTDVVLASLSTKAEELTGFVFEVASERAEVV